MRYAAIMPNDVVDGEGVCVSLWMQGCPNRCKGCHNPELWDPKGGIEKGFDLIIGEILDLLKKNGVSRNFSILGGEPLTELNSNYIWSRLILQRIKEVYPETKTYLWTGYTYEKLNKAQRSVLQYVDVLIDGPYIQEQRNITLKLRGSSNQRVINMQETIKRGEIVLW